MREKEGEGNHENSIALRYAGNVWSGRVYDANRNPVPSRSAALPVFLRRRLAFRAGLRRIPCRKAVMHVHDRAISSVRRIACRC